MSELYKRKKIKYENTNIKPSHFVAVFCFLQKKIPIILIKGIAVNIIIGILKISGNKNTVTKGIKMKVKKDINSIGQVSATIDLSPKVRVWHFNSMGNTTNMVLWKQSDHTIKYQFDTLLQAYTRAKRLLNY